MYIPLKQYATFFKDTGLISNTLEYPWWGEVRD